MSATTMPIRQHTVHTGMTFSVDIVDGNGLDVAWEPVTVHFRHEDGSETVALEITDPGGRARFDVGFGSATRDVVIRAGRESLGPLRPDPGSHLVIEM